MKKNLRNILALSLGLMTTVAFAQDWNADSRTRIDMSGDNDRQITTQRATLGVTFGGSDWGIHSSTRVNYALISGNQVLTAIPTVYEAYASTDLMGYASLTVGRQALEYGSGMIIGNNDWDNGQTRDAMVFGLDLSMADVTLGYHKVNDGGALNEAVEGGQNGFTQWYVNAARAEGDWSANLLYASAQDMVNGDNQDAVTLMGLDLSYAMMDGALNLDVMYNTVNGTTDDLGNAADMDMNMIGATYNVNDDISISASQTTYGENGYEVYGGNALVYGATAEDINGNEYVLNPWMTHGNIGHLDAEQKNISIGGTYAMGNISLGATMHTITDESETAVDGWERKAMELNVGYALNDNVNLSLKYVTDNAGGDEDDKYTWFTLTVTP